MELLNNCFEGADYVELIQETEDHGGDPKRSRTQLVRPKTERPPRRLPEILCALGVTAGAMVLGAGIGQQIWVLVRIKTADWCMGAKGVNNLGLDAAHLGKAAQAVYCTAMRNEPSIEVAVAALAALVCGPLALRLAFGRAYFVSWNEEEEMRELQRLYRTRSSGEWLVLAAWKSRVLAFFFLDILVWMWLRYYLDLYLDIQAMQIFWESGELWFLFSNLGGIVLGLVWTAVEFYKILRETEGGDGPTLPGYQVLIVGLLIPLAGSHVTYLSILSLVIGQKHRFLFISTLAESILESAVSAFVQTYAVVFSDLPLGDKADLYASIALSFISIGYAFASLDRYDGGELLVQLPGLCRNTSWVWWAVFLFRVCEVTSRAASLALFQCVMRGWAIAFVVIGDGALMLTLAAVHQLARSRKLGWTLLKSNIFFALPSSICLMTPLLEKDSPLALQPELYYLLRVLELVGMLVLCGEKLAWNLDSAREIFSDDALMVATFCWSTLLMVVLGLWLRTFHAVRAMLEAPSAMWSMRAFTPTQQILRDRILDGAKPKPEDQKKIITKIRTSPHRPSWEQRADMGSELPAYISSEVWAAGYLTARLSCCMEQALQSLEDTFLSSCGDIGVTDNIGNNLVVARGSSKRALGGPAADPHRENGKVELRTGALVHIQCNRQDGKHALTSADSRIAMRWAGNQTNQKFVVEPASEDDEPGDIVFSGDMPLRVRALERGRFVRVLDGEEDDEAKEADEECPAYSRPELDPDREMELAEDAEVATAFTLSLCHEEEYRTAKRFVLHVRPSPGSLEIANLEPTGTSDNQRQRDWLASGWRIALVNGEVATKDLLEEIMKAAGEEDGDEPSRISMSSPRDATSARSTSIRSQKSAGSHSFLRQKSTAGRLFKRATSTADSVHGGDGKLRVTFEKAYGSDMPICFGDKAILRVAREACVGEPVGLGSAWQRGKTGLERQELGCDSMVVARSIDPVVVTLEPADIGSHDDPPLYSWAAEEMHRRAQANVVRASLSEKCRVAMVVAFNARSTTSGWVVDQELHLRMMRLLASLVRGTREVEVQFDGQEEILEELRLGPSEATRPLVVQAVDAPDGVAASAGVQAGDEIVELEIDRGGNRDCILRSAKDIRRVLQDSGSGGGEPVALVFRSTSRVPVDSGIQKVLLGQAGVVAQIMPTWEEILNPLPELRRAHTPGRWSAAAAQLLRHNEFFRLKCSLVTSLLKQGWEMKYAAFAESAMTLHEHFQVLTYEGFRSRFPGKDELSRLLCQDLLVTQLDVLTASWAAVPKAVKEHQPSVLRKLFRHNVELRAMCDAVQVVYLRWRKQTEEPKVGDTVEATWDTFTADGKECAKRGDIGYVSREPFTNGKENISVAWERTGVTSDHELSKWKTVFKKVEEASNTLGEMPGELQRFLERVRPTHSVDAGALSWIRQAWFGPEHKDEYKAVQEILDYFTQIYLDTEQYWMTKLDGAAQNMENTQEQLEKALDSADMRVALVPADRMAKELKRIQGILSPDKLVLLEDLKVGDSDIVDKGMRMLRRGQIDDHFGPDVGNLEVHRRLVDVTPGDGTDLRLLFGGEHWDEARNQAIKAIEDLGSVIRVVQTAAAAFPNTVAAQCQELLDKHHKGEMRAVLQENKRRIQVQQKEAQEMVRTANIKLVMAEEQKKAAVEKLKEAEEERAMAEAAKKEALERADAWWENLQGISKEKQKLEVDKRTLEDAMVAVERDKDRLENEKLEWTKAQSRMELEMVQLQQDIEKAREEAKSLEASADKWHKTLQTVKREAEEKEAHLREIQDVLQAHQVGGGAPRPPQTVSSPRLSPVAGPTTPRGSVLAMPAASREQAEQETSPGAMQDPGAAFSQLLTILSRALNQHPVERQISILSHRSLNAQN